MGMGGEVKEAGGGSGGCGGGRAQVEPPACRGREMERDGIFQIVWSIATIRSDQISPILSPIFDMLLKAVETTVRP